jgi:hypothetical protein
MKIRAKSPELKGPAVAKNREKQGLHGGIREEKASAQGAIRRIWVGLAKPAF